MRLFISVKHSRKSAVSIYDCLARLKGLKGYEIVFKDRFGATLEVTKGVQAKIKKILEEDCWIESPIAHEECE